MEKKKHKEPPEFEVIEAAINGDVESINQVVSFFQPFIESKCRRRVKDEFGRTYYEIDEYMKRRMEIKLITKILDFEILV